MSGIAGIYYPDGGPVDSAALQRMEEALAHRGPDDRGLWAGPSVCFVHRMLRTTPESLHEHLPLANATDDVVVSADVRIDNRDELIVALGLTDRPPAAIGDGELI